MCQRRACRILWEVNVWLALKQSTLGLDIPHPGVSGLTQRKEGNRHLAVQEPQSSNPGDLGHERIRKDAVCKVRIRNNACKVRDTNTVFNEINRLRPAMLARAHQSSQKHTWGSRPVLHQLDLESPHPLPSTYQGCARGPAPPGSGTNPDSTGTGQRRAACSFPFNSPIHPQPKVEASPSAWPVHRKICCPTKRCSISFAHGERDSLHWVPLYTDSIIIKQFLKPPK